MPQERLWKKWAWKGKRSLAVWSESSKRTGLDFQKEHRFCPSLHARPLHSGSRPCQSNLNGVKGSSVYFKIHLGDVCTKQMEATLRRSQTQLKAQATRCWSAECDSPGGAWWDHRHLSGFAASRTPSRHSLQIKCWRLILLFTFFWSKKLLWMSL